MARIGNKMKFGLEAAGATALVEPTLKAIGMAGRVAGDVTAPVAAPVARQALRAGTALSTAGGRLAENLLGAERVEDIASVFRFRGNLPQDVAEIRSTIRGKMEAEATQAWNTIQKLRDNIDDAYKGVEEVMVGQTPMTRADAHDTR
jgi:metal-dependent amidase/aminoacylase/carboxypeptidase family protein